MSDEYLWDRSGEPDADEIWLERKMPALRPAARALNPIAEGAVYGAFRERAAAVPSVSTSPEIPAMPPGARNRSLTGFQAAMTAAALAAGVAAGYYGFGNRPLPAAADSVAAGPTITASAAEIASRAEAGESDEQRQIHRFPEHQPAPELGDHGRQDPLDGADVQRTVSRYTSSVRRSCWQPALDTRKPGAPTAARVTVTITVEADGRVANVATSGEVNGYPGLTRCIASRVRAWQFPASSGTTTVNVPFVFAKD
jgi:hypothetical protein